MEPRYVKLLSDAIGPTGSKLPVKNQIYSVRCPTILTYRDGSTARGIVLDDFPALAFRETAFETVAPQHGMKLLLQLAFDANLAMKLINDLGVGIGCTIDVRAELREWSRICQDVANGLRASEARVRPNRAKS